MSPFFKDDDDVSDFLNDLPVCQDHLVAAISHPESYESIELAIDSCVKAAQALKKVGWFNKFGLDTALEAIIGSLARIKYSFQVLYSTS